MTKHISLAFCALIIFTGCIHESPEATLIINNGKIYTVNEKQPWAEAVAVRNAEILAVGSNTAMEKYKRENTKIIDAQHHFVMPGFIEGHGHFSGLGKSLLQLNFLTSKSWEEIVEMVAAAAKNIDRGEWIEGRGWHQEKWDSLPAQSIQGYPRHYKLSAASPDNPVVLRHASGHSVFANEKAMQLAGITKETPDPKGGAIIRDNQGQPIGVFEEEAMGLILEAYKQYLNTLSAGEIKDKWMRGINLAQRECLQKGITSFQDAGTAPGQDYFSSFEEIQFYRELARAGKLKLRIWAMLRQPAADLEKMLSDGFPILNAGDHYFTCRAVKSELDGALGSYGAWLLKPYNDKPGFSGQNTTPLTEVEKIARLCKDAGMQLCVHAIGDRANRETLDLYEKTGIAGHDLRWRIEHAQHIAPVDIPRFEELGVIAAMQAIHCTSDAPFVIKRLGKERARTGAYAWRSLLDAGTVVTNGTDAPVEDVDPLASFYAAVTRKRQDSGYEFFPQQRMTRQEAIYAYTMANAFAAFEEKVKGSIEPGKLADFTILDTNLIECEAQDIPNAQVLYTIVGGDIRYEKE